MNISKYFWDLNRGSLRETEKILKNPRHPRFSAKMVTFLSRCDKPRELYTVLPKKKFIESWPKIRSYWMKIDRRSTFRDWWQTIYEELLGESRKKRQRVIGKTPAFFSKLGIQVRQARIRKGLSQEQLALTIGMKQPDVSKIEEGKNNMTLNTLMRLCKILGIKKYLWTNRSEKVHAGKNNRGSLDSFRVFLAYKASFA